MSSGKLGVLVIMIALVGALFGSWAMSMDVNENEVTKYDPLADMTGEFQSEAVPEYTKFNPSTNYTGYFTEESIIGTDVFFDGVSYTESNPNNYRLNLKPTELDSGVYDLSTISSYSSNYRYAIYCDYQDNRFYVKFNNDQHDNYDGKTISLKTLVQTMNTGHDYNLIELSSIDNKNYVTTYGQNESVNWCVFSTKSEWAQYRDSYHFIEFASDSAIENPSSSYTHMTPVKLSAKINLETGQVRLYYDNAFTQEAGIYTLDEVLITIDGGNPGSSIPAGYLAFGHNVNYRASHLLPPSYMNPSEGVELT